MIDLGWRFGKWLVWILVQGGALGVGGKGG